MVLAERKSIGGRTEMDGFTPPNSPQNTVNLECYLRIEIFVFLS
jgi:hypothetical protein